MKIQCKKCNKTLTKDLYLVKVKRDGITGGITNLKDIWLKDDPEWDYLDWDDDSEEVQEPSSYNYGSMKAGIFYKLVGIRSYNNKYCDERPAQIIKSQKDKLVVGRTSIVEGVVPKFKSGYGCCDYSMGEPLICTCGNEVGEMYLDCYEDSSINFHVNKIRRVYIK